MTTTTAPPGEETDPPVRRWFASLQARLATVVVVVLVLGLSLTGGTAWALLSRSLVSEVDAQLEQVVEPLAQVASRNLLGGLPLSRTETESLPSDYFVLFVSADATVRRQWSSTASGQPRSAPAIGSMTLEEVLEARGEQFTVSSIDGASRWRVVALPLTSRTGSVAVALPMDTLDAASAQLRTVLIGVGGLVTVLGGVLGALAVRRSLRPLREIEHTAAGIASGRLDTRVPVADPRTEVGHLATSLNAMLGRLELAFAARAASEERMRRFVSDASHELRTPLATVRGYAELYRMGAVTTPEQMADTMRRVEESAARMGLLVEDLLALARLDERAALAARERVDLTALAQDAAQDLVALDPTREVTVVGLDGSAPVPAWVLGDPARLRQVLTNLVGNVAGHTSAGSPCEIAVGQAVVGGAGVRQGVVGQHGAGQHGAGQHGAGQGVVGQHGAGQGVGGHAGTGRAPEGTGVGQAVGDTGVRGTAVGPPAVGHPAPEATRPPGATDPAHGAGSPGAASAPMVVLEVRDRGPGVAPEHVERIFERFYRADASRGRAEGGGAGLGLAIVASIVESHGGWVDAGPREGGGSVFRVQLPLA